MNSIKYTLTIFLALWQVSVFAQEEPEKAEPEKIAVYVFGASDAGINKSLGSKLLFAVAQGGKYSEIRNSKSFYEELEKSYNGDIEQIAKLAGKHGADVVCVVGMTEAFGDYSISAWLLKTSNFQVIKTSSLDRSLKSLDDLTRVSNELASQFFGLPPPAPELSPPPAALAPAVAAAPEEAPVAKKECANKLNLNEIISKIQSGFPTQLKDCSVTLAKNMALAASPFGKKTEQKDPKTFMTECTIDGIKKKLPVGAEEYVKPIENFVQNILNAAVGAAGLDVKKLSGAIGSMNVNDLINELKTKAANDECMVDEPYTPVAEAEDKGGASDEKKDRKILSFGIRAGMNFSHLYVEYYKSNSYYGDSEGSYYSTPGLQLGLVLDIAPSSWFHIQPGLMYIQKGAEDRNYNVVTSHYIEVPLLLSLKFSAFRLNAGPYFGMCLDSNMENDCGSGSGSASDGGSNSASTSLFDIGISMGFGFDIGMFYIGVFYDHGLNEFYDYHSSSYSGTTYMTSYNRTIGFNLGVNL